jgi:hypothetical protein
MRNTAPCAVSLTCVLLCLMSCDSRPSQTASKSDTKSVNEEKMTEMPIQDPNDPRTVVPFTEEQTQQMNMVTRAIVRVISKQNSLSEEESLFGEGKDHWPKAPGPILLRYYTKKLPDSNLSIEFERINDKEVWSSGAVGFRPKNFPRGVYRMDLPSTFFSDFVLEKAYAEDQPKRSIKRINIFQFRSQKGTANVQLQFEAREDVSSLQDKYPKSFHFLKVTRTGE